MGMETDYYTLMAGKTALYSGMNQKRCCFCSDCGIMKVVNCQGFRKGSWHEVINSSFTNA